jgi:hypothetical protein
MLRTATLARCLFPAITASMFLASTALARPADDAKEGDSSADKAPSEAAEPADSVWNTKEDPTKPYRYVGIRYRHVVVPQFVLNLFAEGGALQNVPIAGLEYGSRRNHLEYIFSLSFADYATGDMLFKGEGDPDEDYELVNSDLGVVFAKFELLYEIPLDLDKKDKSHFALLIGGGIGIGGVFGELYRAQAYPKQAGADPEDATQWARCTQFDVTATGYCTDQNDHFGSYAEPSWINGGSKPLVFPWLALPQVSFRYKPFKFLQARADVGLALSSGFYFGASIDYIL